MSSKNLIDLEDRDLIKVLLQRLKNKSSRVRLWQKLSSLNKCNTAQVECIDFASNKVLLKPYKGRSEFFLAPTPFVYFHSHYRTTLFKTAIKERGPFHLEIEMPDFVKIQEGRKEERMVLPKETSYKAFANFECHHEPIKVEVLDISLSGVGLGVSKGLFELCEIGSVITIDSKNIPNLKNQVAMIRNKGAYCPYGGKEKKVHFRIGLEFF